MSRELSRQLPNRARQRVLKGHARGHVASLMPTSGDSENELKLAKPANGLEEVARNAL